MLITTVTKSKRDLNDNFLQRAINTFWILSLIYIAGIAIAY